MIVHLDTSALIQALVPNGSLTRALRALVRAGDRPGVSSLALFEWLRGPRTPEELQLRSVVLPDEKVVAFGPSEAALAADLARAVERPDRRAAELAIAACAIEREALLWTLHPEDFEDIPGLGLYEP